MEQSGRTEAAAAAAAAAATARELISGEDRKRGQVVVHGRMRESRGEEEMIFWIAHPAMHGWKNSFITPP